MKHMQNKKVLLCVLDGLGLNPNPNGNAVLQAKTPVLDSLFENSPSSTLITSGEAVGLPEGQMGNSEVGHINIGAGRVVEQWLLRIERGLRRESLLKNNAFITFAKKLRSESKLHLLGLLSDGGVHSHEKHLYSLIETLSDTYNPSIVLHVITDGRDTSPQSGYASVKKLIEFIKRFPNVSLGTLQGRFFPMDRDKRWERSKKAYDAITCAEGPKLQSVDALLPAIEASYKEGIYDEFIEPCIIGEYKGVAKDDLMIFWNFRADRMRQIVYTLCCDAFEKTFPSLTSSFLRKVVNTTEGQGFPFSKERILQFTDYDPALGLQCLFPNISIKNYLGEVVASRGFRQLRIAETEKYPHVTYFLNGGEETPCLNEERVLIQSPKDVKTYDLKPEMSAYAVKDAVLSGLRSGTFDLIVVNFANCDMVGHTGVFDAAVSAVQTVDTCLGEVLNALPEDWCAVIIADHGNAEQMIDYETKLPHTAHTTYPVPIFVYKYAAKESLSIASGALCDVAPTVLEIMGIKQPVEMEGSSLLVNIVNYAR
jgi:2,3-bisphosphoglycerate-independent phosphoglycerate mutase